MICRRCSRSPYSFWFSLNKCWYFSHNFFHKKTSRREVIYTKKHNLPKRALRNNTVKRLSYSLNLSYHTCHSRESGNPGLLKMAKLLVILAGVQNLSQIPQPYHLYKPASTTLPSPTPPYARKAAYPAAYRQCCTENY